MVISGGRLRRGAMVVSGDRRFQQAGAVVIECGCRLRCLDLLHEAGMLSKDELEGLSR
jgi:hypothetical protein